MYRILPLFIALFLLSGMVRAESYRCRDVNGYFVYSGKPCADKSDTAKAFVSAESGSSAKQKVSSRKVYTKEIVPMRSPDAATQACFNYKNTTAHFPDPSTTRLLSGAKKWVPVKNVGGRLLVTISVTSKNEAGMYVGIESFSCLLMGDNVTVNTGDYEIIADD